MAALEQSNFHFILEYSVTHPLKTGFSRPVIVHRAIFGSLERFIAILCEQTGGKWDFWLSPRQIKLIPIGKEAKEFAEQVYNTLLLSNYSVAVDNSGDQLAKKVRNAQLEGYNFIGVIGPEEIKDKQINLRKRDQEEPIGKFDVPSLLKMFSEAKPPKSKKRLEIEEKSFKA
jgi:threonyl-tRNA synthetase